MRKIAKAKPKAKPRQTPKTAKPKPEPEPNPLPPKPKLKARVKTISMALNRCLRGDVRAEGFIATELEDAVQRASRIVHDAALLSNALVCRTLEADALAALPAELDGDLFFANVIYRVSGKGTWPTHPLKLRKEKTKTVVKRRKTKTAAAEYEEVVIPAETVEELAARTAARARLRVDLDAAYAATLGAAGHVLTSRAALAEVLHSAATQLATNADLHLTTQTTTLLERIAKAKLPIVGVRAAVRDTVARRLVRFWRGDRTDAERTAGLVGPPPLVLNDPEPCTYGLRVTPAQEAALTEWAGTVRATLVGALAADADAAPAVSWDLHHRQRLRLNAALMPLYVAVKTAKALKAQALRLKKTGVKPELRPTIAKASLLPLRSAKPQFVHITAKAVKTLFGLEYVAVGTDAAGKRTAHNVRKCVLSAPPWWRRLLSVPERHLRDGFALTSFTTDGVQIKLCLERPLALGELEEAPGLRTLRMGPKERRAWAPSLPKIGERELDVGPASCGVYDLKSTTVTDPAALRGTRVIGVDPGRVDVATWAVWTVPDDATTETKTFEPPTVDALRGQHGSLSNWRVRWEQQGVTFRHKEERRRKRIPGLEALFTTLETHSARTATLAGVAAHAALIYAPASAALLERYYWGAPGKPDLFHRKWRFRRFCAKQAFADNFANQMLGCTRRYERRIATRLRRNEGVARAEAARAALRPPRVAASPETRAAHRAALAQAAAQRQAPPERASAVAYRAALAAARATRAETRTATVTAAMAKNARDLAALRAESGDPDAMPSYAPLQADGVTPCARTIVGFGNGGFSVCSAGSDPCPRKSLLVPLARRAVVVMVDEYRTSQACSRCGAQTAKLARRRTGVAEDEEEEDDDDGALVPSEALRAARLERRRRGRILRCPACKPSAPEVEGAVVPAPPYAAETEEGGTRLAACLWNRDVNAANNMQACTLAWLLRGDRPEALRRPPRAEAVATPEAISNHMGLASVSLLEPF